jgi:hypothetical protein
MVTTVGGHLYEASCEVFIRTCLVRVDDRSVGCGDIYGKQRFELCGGKSTAGRRFLWEYRFKYLNIYLMMEWEDLEASSNE